MTAGLHVGLAGSEVAGIGWVGDTLRIRLAVATAWRAMPDAAPGQTGGEPGYLPAVDLHLGGARCDADLADAVGALHEADCRIDGVALPRLPVPFVAGGDVRLTLRFGNRAELALQARALEVRQTRDADFLPSLAC